METSGKESYYLQDDLGSPMHLLGADGTAQEAYAFDEFGQQMEDRSSIITGKDIFRSPLQPFGYTGYQMDEAGGLYFAQARRYDAGSGRFVSEDIFQGTMLAPYTMNHYGYCWNRPLDLLDLNGMWPSLSDIGNGIKNTASKAVEWCSDHKAAAVSIGVAIAAVAIIGIVTCATGGALLPVLAGAAIGAGVSGGLETIKEGISDGWDHLDSDKIIMATSTGAISGAMLGSNAGVAVSTVSSGLISMGNSIGNTMIDYERDNEINVPEAIESAGISLMLGLLGGRICGEGAQYNSYTVSEVKQIIFDGTDILSVSQKKIRVFAGSYKPYAEVLRNNFVTGTAKTIGTGVGGAGVAAGISYLIHKINIGKVCEMEAE